MRRSVLIVSLLSLTLSARAACFTVAFTQPVVQGVETKAVITYNGDTAVLPAVVVVNGDTNRLVFGGREAEVVIPSPGKAEYTFRIGDEQVVRQLRPIPLWMSILPPLIAILMALLLREVFTALFAGLFSGVLIINLYAGKGVILALLHSFLAIPTNYFLRAVAGLHFDGSVASVDYSHLSIIIFSLFIGGMVSLVTRNGGMQGIVNSLARHARGPVSGQLVTWAMGIAIFFDDYANTLVVGNTMRPVTDRLNISREKLSYIVDSTAAPVAAVALVTTWIGAELGYIQDGLGHITIEMSAYEVFLHSLKFSFYPIFTLGFILMLVRRKVDYGPMLHAERLARKGQLTPGNIKEGGKDTFWEEDLVKPSHWLNGVVPVLFIVFGTLAGLTYTGLQNHPWDGGIGAARNISGILGASDPYASLLWASLGGIIVALAMTLLQRLVSLRDSMESIMRGFKTMITAMAILILAWSIALITEEMHTADFIARSMESMRLTPHWIPMITFLAAALISFSTGSSWGTMAILYPLILGSSWNLALSSGMSPDAASGIFFNVVSAVLAGSVFGDHCSPISDTTIMSSLASSCDHIEHVRTQLPYALTVGLVSMLVGTLPAAFGAPPYVTYPAGLITLYIIIRLLGRKVVLDS